MTKDEVIVRQTILIYQYKDNIRHIQTLVDRLYEDWAAEGRPQSLKDSVIDLSNFVDQAEFIE